MEEQIEDIDVTLKEFIELFGNKLVNPEHNPRSFSFMLAMFNYYRSDKLKKFEKQNPDMENAT